MSAQEAPTPAASAGAAVPVTLDPLTLPLRGSRLVEASAGTGKTYTIAALYLRLVLGHGGEAAGHGAALTPPQILVVTFTDAATKELRDRIRSRLAEAAEAFDADPAAAPARDSGADLLHDLRAAWPSAQWPALARTLRLAAEWMDEAAVSTIHGWCLRMLREHAFDSGSLFAQELEANTRALLAAVARDWWRHHATPLDEAAARTLRSWWKEPDALAGDVDRLIDWAATLPDDPAPALTLGSAQQALEALRPSWAHWPGELRGLLDQAQAARQLHGSKLRPDWYQGWLDALERWGRGLDATPDLDRKVAAWTRLTPAGIADAWKGGTPPDHPAFQGMEALTAARDAVEACRARVLHHAARWCGRELAAEKERQSRMGFQDLLTRLDAALQGTGGERLAARIRAQFPVALVDEFQDTDPVQYRIFDRVWGVDRADAATALLLIGDPKQSIYAFRGADIHTYLQARAATAGRHATLGVNHRSTSAMVEAVNRVFAQAEARTDGPGAFRLRPAVGDNPLPFHPVQARGREETWVVDGAEPPALTLWHVGSGQAQVETMAALCAQQVVALLRAGAQGRAGFRDRAGRLRGVMAADIAVLVDTGAQAALVRSALRARGVRSVYLSEKDSVFHSTVAADLQRWLRACAAPQDERLRRAALATATLGLRWAELDRLNHDEDHAEAMAQRFRAYQQAWRIQGVLPMLSRLMHDFALPARMLAQGQERELTDLLHLAEWLQQASAALDGEHALVRHLALQRDDANDARGDELRRLRLESDAGLVKVVTVHKSKGLEYPLVLLPYASWCRPAKATDMPWKWHDPRLGRRVAVSGDDAELAQVERERRGEDLRKLYVALTRARFATWVGVADQKHLSASALGSLLPPAPGAAESGSRARPANRKTATAEAGEARAALRARLEGLRGGCAAIAVTDPPLRDQARYQEAGQAPVWRDAPPLPASPAPAWWVASYSGLMARAAAAGGPGAGLADEGAMVGAAPGAGPGGAADSPAEDVYQQSAGEGDALGVAFTADAVPPASRRGELPGERPAEGAGAGLLHGFPQGARAGSFLHGLLEWAGREGFGRVADDPAELDELIAQRCAQNGYGAWAGVLQRWMRAWLDTAWDLSALQGGAGRDHGEGGDGGDGRHGAARAGGVPTPVRPRELRRLQVELEFWLPADAADVARIDALVTRHTLGGAARAPLGAQRLNGLLKGYIDLVFEHDGRYYVADHKSNRLGDGDAAYTAEAMRRAVLGHRYELQYVLYLLALHRLLRARLGAAYAYDRHVGGAVYLFLRGHAAPGGGLHLERPPRALIEALDAVFAGRDAWDA
jgi:exodeoxyribonuclease V beta subunit